jgi:hypothetical protein
MAYVSDIRKMMNPTTFPGEDQFSRFGRISGGILIDDNGRQWKRHGDESKHFFT